MARQNSRNISLNVNLAVPQNGLQLPDGSHTPSTPEVLNSIVSMQTTPFVGFQQPIVPGNISKEYTKPESISKEAFEPSVNDCVSQSSPSVEHYKSQFIKAGLKIKLSKQRTRPGHVENSGFSYPSGPIDDSGMASLQQTSSSSRHTSKRDDLTDEDRQRRLRRRERNKVAASKCRDKKKFRTQLLFKESESLIHMNGSLKQEVQRLEHEKQQLENVLKLHEPLCTKRTQILPPCPYQGNFDNTGPSVDLGGDNFPYNSDIYDISGLPVIKVELSSPSEEEIFPPTHAGTFCDPPSFSNIHVDPQNHFPGMRPSNSGFHRNPNYHSSDTHCIAL